MWNPCCDRVGAQTLRVPLVLESMTKGPIFQGNQIKVRYWTVVKSTDRISQTPDWWSQFLSPIRQFGERVADFFSPNAEAAATHDSYEIALELPGISEDDIHLEVHGNQLVVTGEKHAQREESGRNYLFSERVYGRFRRTFEVAADADLTGVEAVHKDGVLEITIPKLATKPSEGQRIEIKRG